MDDLDHTSTSWVVQYIGMEPNTWLTDPTNTLKRTRKGHLPQFGYKQVLAALKEEFETMRISDITPKNIEATLRKYIRRIERDRFVFHTKDAQATDGTNYVYYELSRKLTPYTSPIGIRCRPFITFNGNI